MSDAVASSQHRRQVVRTRWTAALIIVMWLWVAVPRTLQSVLSPKYRSSVGVQAPPYNSLAALALLGLTLAAIGLCLLILIDTWKDPHRGGLFPLVVMLAPWLFVVIRDLYVQGPPTLADLLYPLVVFAFWSLRPPLKCLSVLGYCVLGTAIISTVLALLLPEKGIFRTLLGAFVAEDKELVPWGMLVGIFTHGNTMGQFIVLGIPAVMMIHRPIVRNLSLVLCAVVILWSASRSSMAAFGIVVLGAAAVGVFKPARRGAIGVVVAALPFLFVVLLPLTTADPLAFTNRGLIWAASLRAWSSEPVIGLGSSWYSTVGGSAERLASTVFHGHNQFVQFMVTGGIVLTFLVGIQIVVLCIRAGRLAVSDSKFGVLYLASLGGTCILEKSFVLVDNVSLFPVVVVPLAILAFAPIPPAPRPNGNQGVKVGILQPELPRAPAGAAVRQELTTRS